MAGRPLIVAAAAALLVASCTAGSADVVTERVEHSIGVDPPAVGEPAVSEPATGDSEPATGDEPIPPTVSDAPTTLPNRAEPGSLDWSNCPTADLLLVIRECATLRVPLDHADPGGAMIDIAVARQRSTGSEDERIGSLVINPGGPGGSGVDALATFSVLMSETVKARFDLVSFDPRGVGASTALACDADRDDRIAVVPDDDRPAWDAVAEADLARLETCTAATIALASHVGTNNVARDLDLLRAALGDEQLTYLGYSYGTRLGATYAELFAENVRALVLDGGVKPDSSNAELDREQGGGFDRALANFAASCDADEDCALRDVGPALEVIERLIREIDAAGSLPTDLADRVLTPGELRLGIASALYSRESWPYLASALADAATARDATLLQVLGDVLVGRGPDGTYDNSTTARRFVNCADDPARVAASAQWALSDAAGDASEFFGEFLRASTGCLGVQSAIDPLVIGPAVGAPPIVVIGTTGDPATPYAWSVDLAELLDSAVLFTVEAEGHTSYGSVECVGPVIDAYLIELTVPQQSSCADAAGSDAFLPPGDSELDRVLALFDCLRDGGADLPEITAADLLADPTGETIAELLDFASPSFQVALIGCAELIAEF